MYAALCNLAVIYSCYNNTNKDMFMAYPHQVCWSLLGINWLTILYNATCCVHKQKHTISAVWVTHLLEICIEELGPTCLDYGLSSSAEPLLEPLILNNCKCDGKGWYFISKLWIPWVRFRWQPTPNEWYGNSDTMRWLLEVRIMLLH